MIAACSGAMLLSACTPSNNAAENATYREAMHTTTARCTDTASKQLRNPDGTLYTSYSGTCASVQGKPRATFTSYYLKRGVRVSSKEKPDEAFVILNWATNNSMACSLKPDARGVWRPVGCVL